MPSSLKVSKTKVKQDIWRNDCLMGLDANRLVNCVTIVATTSALALPFSQLAGKYEISKLSDAA